MKLVAITGGIASGKSTVDRRLVERGALLVDADLLAREVVQPGTPGLAAIEQTFGSQVIAADGTLDRPALGAIIFADAERREELNAITHPAIWHRAHELFAAAEAADPEAIVVYDVPLLAEAKGDREMSFDLVVVVDAHIDTRIDRMVSLRGMSREEAEGRLRAQASDADRLRLADVVIDANGTLDQTLEQVDELWERLRSEPTEAGRMTTPQKPLPSGFDARTTAAEAVAGIDLHGKLAIVTGGYSGLGLETVRALHGAGAHIVVPARRPQVAREALAAAGLDDVEVDSMDLADLESVGEFANRFLESDRGIDILIDNAAIMAAPEARVGDGWESQFATNHLGHYVLANLLWPALVRDGGARVIALTSTGHKFSDIRWDDPQFTTGYEKWEAYGQAKTADSLFAIQLDALGAPFGVRAFAVHPGGIMTELQRHLPREEMVAAGWMDAEGNVNERFKSPEQGAATSVWAATSSQLDGIGGVYLEDVDVARPTEVGSESARVSGVDAHAIDRDSAARLWDLSARLTGVNAFQPV